MAQALRSLPVRSCPCRWSRQSSTSPWTAGICDSVEPSTISAVLTGIRDYHFVGQDVKLHLFGRLSRSAVGPRRAGGFVDRLDFGRPTGEFRTGRSRCIAPSDFVRRFPAGRCSRAGRAQAPASGRKFQKNLVAERHADDPADTALGAILKHRARVRAPFSSIAASPSPTIPSVVRGRRGSTRKFARTGRSRHRPAGRSCAGTPTGRELAAVRPVQC